MYKHLYNVFHMHKAGSCEHANFFGDELETEHYCYIAHNECSYQYQFVNLFVMTYCWLDGYWLIGTALQFFFIFIVFRFIQAVVEEYLAPSISYLSEWLKLPEALGAVTLLALANGAGDVVTAIAASSQSGGISYNVGSIYGAGLFVCSIVVAMTINNSTESIELDANTIWRDVGFYILSTIIMIGFAIHGILSIFSAVALILVYFIMVAVVWFQEKDKVPIDKEEEEDPNTSKREEPTEEKKVQLMEQKNLIYIPNEKTQEEQLAYPKKWRSVLNKLNTATGQKRNFLLTQKFKTTVVLLMKLQKKAEEEHKEWQDMPFNEKVMHIMDLPFYYIRKITLPPCEESKYEKKWAVIFPAPGLIFHYLCLADEVKLYIVAIMLVVGLLFSVIIWKTSSSETIPPKYYPLMQIFGTVGAIVWTYLACGLLIDILQFLGMISKLSKTYLGLTIIAVGNALPDGITTIALAKQGYAVMGLTGAYAGQLFGLLVGFGLALLKKTLQDGPQVFDLFDPQYFGDNFMNILVIFVSLINLLVTFFYGLYNHYHFTKTLAKLIGGLYMMFMATSTITAVVMAMDS